MHEAEEASALIGHIYDAALDSSLWPAVLEKIAAFSGGCAAGLLSKDSVSKLGNAHHQFGVDEAYLSLYREQYWRYDPLAPLIFFDAEDVTSRLDYLSDEEFREGRFHREWAYPQGFIDAANVVLERSATSFSILSVIRSEAQGTVDEDMRRRMRLLVPHVRRAVLIGRVIDLKSAEAATFADTLDAMRTAMFLVDAGGRVVHANAAGKALLAAGDVLGSAGGNLLAAHAPANQELREAFAAAGDGDAALGLKGVAVPLLSRGGDRFVAHALPLTAGMRRHAGMSYGAVAALVVHRAALDVPTAPEVIARTYQLTPTELRVLLAIVEVGGAPEVAAVLGIADTTVKFHLQRLFQKTGARRQADLVKLVAGFCSRVVQ